MISLRSISLRMRCYVRGLASDRGSRSSLDRRSGGSGSALCSRAACGRRVSAKVSAPASRVGSRRRSRRCASRGKVGSDRDTGEARVDLGSRNQVCRLSRGGRAVDINHDTRVAVLCDGILVREYPREHLSAEQDIHPKRQE